MKNKYNATTTNVAIGNDVHKEVLTIIDKFGVKVGKYVEMAVKDRLKKDVAYLEALEKLPKETNDGIKIFNDDFTFTTEFEEYRRTEVGKIFMRYFISFPLSISQISASY